MLIIYGEQLWNKYPDYDLLSFIVGAISKEITTDALILIVDS